MRFALHRIKARSGASRQSQIPPDGQSHVGRMTLRQPHKAEPRRPEPSQPLVPAVAMREISLGSNEGLRTVKLRQPSIEWRVRRTAAPRVDAVAPEAG